MSDATNLPAVLADSSAGDEYAITAPDWGQPQGNGRILSSFDVATPEGKIGLFNAVQGDSVKSGDVINTEVEIVHVVAYAVRFVDKDGQIVDGIRTVLVLKDGRSVAFVSETLYRSVHWLAYSFGKPPWPAGLKVAIRQKETGSGNRIFQLVPILQAKVKK